MKPGRTADHLRGPWWWRLIGAAVFLCIGLAVLVSGSTLVGWFLVAAALLLIAEGVYVYRRDHRDDCR